MALKHAHWDMRSNRNVVFLAVSKHGCAIQYIGTGLDHFIWEAMRQDSRMTEGRDIALAILRHQRRLNRRTPAKWILTDLRRDQEILSLMIDLESRHFLDLQGVELPLDFIFAYIQKNFNTMFSSRLR